MFTNLSEETLRKLKEITDLIAGETVVPSYSDALKAKDELEEILSGEGSVSIGYAKKVLQGLNYAKQKNDYFNPTNSLLDDIIAGKRIIFTKYQ